MTSEGEHKVFGITDGNSLQIRIRVVANLLVIKPKPITAWKEDFTSLFVTLDISKRGMNGKTKAWTILLMKDKDLGVFHEVSLINSPPTFTLTSWEQSLHQIYHLGTSWYLQRLRTDKPPNTLAWMQNNIFFNKKIIRLSEFQLKGPYILFRWQTKESSLTRFSKPCYSQTTTTNSLKGGWQTLLFLIKFTEEAHLIWHFFCTLYKNLGVVLRFIGALLKF